VEMDVNVNKVKNISPIKIQEVKNIDPVEIKKVSKIAPIAAHIKEVNHIDPITVEPLRVNEIRHIDPLSIESVNITKLPNVNVSVHQIPDLNINVRRLPPLAIGMYQNFRIPSEYMVRAQFLGLEILRLHLNGQTNLEPCERYPREKTKVPNKSFQEPVIAGNPAIPTICVKKSKSSNSHHNYKSLNTHHSYKKRNYNRDLGYSSNLQNVSNIKHKKMVRKNNEFTRYKGIYPVYTI
jgi:hypothetical protein